VRHCVILTRDHGRDALGDHRYANAAQLNNM
jgi:hypothetical protein